MIGRIADGRKALSGGESARGLCPADGRSEAMPQRPGAFDRSVLDNLNHTAKGCAISCPNMLHRRTSLSWPPSSPTVSPRLNSADYPSRFWLWVGSYTLEERNQLVQMIGSPASVRFEQELALFRQLWCNLSVEPAHYGAESWENLKAIRENIWQPISDWCIGNSITVDQANIAIPRQVLHLLIQEALQAKISEISNPTGTSVEHFCGHLNEAFDMEQHLGRPSMPLRIRVHRAFSSRDCWYLFAPFLNTSSGRLWSPID